MEVVFVVFLIVGISDVVDGFLVKCFNMMSEFGVLFDLFVDKVLLVLIYMFFGIWGVILCWIVILVVLCDIMIVVVVIVLWLFDCFVEMKFFKVLKLNMVV